MANNVTGNPITVDTTDTTLWSGTKTVRQIQWVNDADDIGDASSLVITTSGGATPVTITIAVLDVSAYPTSIQWECGPFNPGIPMTDIGVTISHGLLLIWL